MKAIVLSGGGSKGSYQVGVWKALRQLHIKYDIITGTSVGALNGALMTQNNYRKAQKIWKQINLKVLFGEDAIDSNKNIDIYKMYSKHFIKNKGMDVEKLESIIAKELDIKKFYRSKINYGLVTYNLSKKQAEELEKKDIKEDQLVDYLMASATCYPAFKKKDIEGLKYIDGGYYDNLPINLAISMGATEIIAVDLRSIGLKRITKKKVKITTIKPNNKLTNFLNFYEEGNKRNIKFGYNDTMKVFNKLEGNQYTFKKGTIKKNEILHKDTYEYIIKKILNSKKLTAEFKRLLKITSSNNSKIMEEFFLQIMERTGKMFDLDETIIYSYKKFNKEIIKRINITKNKKNKLVALKLLQELKNENYKELRKAALIHPIELIKAVYIYTIYEV